MKNKKIILSMVIVLFCIALSCGKRTAPVKIITDILKVNLYQGEKQVFKITIQNNTKNTISTGTGYYFSYHIYDLKGEKISYDNRRYAIPIGIPSHGQSSFNIPLYFRIKKTGVYVVEFDLVQEGGFWGSTQNWKVPKVTLTLKSLFSTTFKDEYLPLFQDTGKELINQEQYLLRLTLKNSEVYHQGKFFGFSAGSNYPAIWIRDAATFTSLALIYYPLSDIKRMIEHFFFFQKNSGEVMDQIDVQGRAQKNTIESDQESSLLIAAAKIWEHDSNWIHQVINQISILDRMEMAVSWVYQNRLNQQYDLIESGFTADWGDVGKDYPDQRALQLRPETTRVMGIYTQAKYIQAITSLIKILKGQSNPPIKKISLWESRKKTFIQQTRKHLYLQDKGYFITHIVPTSTQFFNLEKEMLGVGGNAEAIIAGLMSEGEIKTFILELEKRRKKHQLRTVGFTLIPPYPKDFFKHPLLSLPWKYQNGGEWDWIGGRVVLALFLNNFKEKGEECLLQIIKKNLNQFNINEWQDMRGMSRGADFYTGAAGVIGEAILTGYPLAE